MPNQPTPTLLLKQHQLWLKPHWVNAVLAIVVPLVQAVNLVATVVTALMVCQASLEIVVRQPHLRQS